MVGGCTRITPAGAGKTVLVVAPGGAYRDHPRRCGENRRRERGEGVYLGSPPQVRGKRDAVLLFSRSDRITPAGAGKTFYNKILYITD